MAMRQNSQAENDLQSHFAKIKEELSGYITKRIELFKLRSYEKTSIASSYEIGRAHV